MPCDFRAMCSPRAFISIAIKCLRLVGVHLKCWGLTASVTLRLPLALMFLRDDKCPGVLPEGSVLTWEG